MRSTALLKSVHRHRVRSPARGEQRRLVDEVRQIRPRESRRERRHLLGLDVGGELHLAHVHPQDIDAPLLVRAVHEHLAVEASGPQERRVEDLGPVGGAQQDEARPRVEPVELHEELIERLLLLVVPADHAAQAASAPEGIELVDEDDGGRLLARLGEEIAHPGRADAHEHFHELGAGDREERHLRLAGDRLGEERLAGAGRPDQEHAFRHASAEPPVLLRVLQKVDDLPQLVLGLVDARHVIEPHAGVGLDVDLGLRLADLHQPAAESALGGDAAGKIGPHAEEECDRDHPRQNVPQERALDLARVADPVLLQLLREIGVDAGRREPGLAARQGLLESALDEPVGDADLGHLPGPEQFLKLAVGNRRDLLRHADEVLDQQDAEDSGDPVPGVEALCLVHDAPSRTSSAGKPALTGSTCDLGAGSVRQRRIPGGAVHAGLHGPYLDRRSSPIRPNGAEFLVKEPRGDPASSQPS